MFLASVAGIREELGFDDMTDINAAISMALNAAEPQLASALNTSFARTDVVDTFWVSEPTVIEAGHVQTEFWLSRGFLAADPTVTVSTGLDTTDALRVDLHKGVVRDWKTYYHRAHVTFAYAAGFEAEVGSDDKPTGSYKLDQVPGWLKEAAKLQALILLSSAPSVTEAGVQIDTEVLKLQVASIMEQHIRYAPMALYPL